MRPVTLLIVDDQQSSLRWLESLFTEAGYKVLVADSGQLALSAVLETKPDAILLDVLMPGLDGYEVCRRLKEQPASRTIPVIFLSALEHPSDRVRGFLAGCVDFIQKPIQEEEALLRVKTQCELRRLQSDLETLVTERTEKLQEEILIRQKTEFQLQHALDANKMLLRELQHRAKNSFAMILGMIQLQGMKESDPRSGRMLGEIESRVKSVAELYTLLYEKGAINEIPLHDYLHRIAVSLLDLEGCHELKENFVQITIPTAMAAPLGLITTELITNSIKYAFAQREKGIVSLSLGMEGQNLVLKIADNGLRAESTSGSGHPTGILKEGTGLTLVRALCEQISASHSLETREGYCHRIVIPNIGTSKP